MFGFPFVSASPLFADASVLLSDCHRVTIHYDQLSNEQSSSHCEYGMALNL